MKALKFSPSIFLIIGLIGLTLFSSCGKASPEEMIARTWKLKSLNVKQQIPPSPEVMASSVFIFNKDGSYEILLGEVDRGYWRISDDGHVLITRSLGAFQDKLIDIIELTDTSLVLTNKYGESPVTMTLTPKD